MEEFDQYKTTQAVNTEGFISVSPDKEKPTQSDEEKENSSSTKNKWVEPIPKAVKALEEHSAFTGSMVALIGYIIIAAWGRMTNYADFVRYIVFLGLIFILYRALKVRLQDFVLRRRDWILLIICILLILFIFIENFSEILKWFSNFTETLKQSSLSTPEQANN